MEKPPCGRVRSDGRRLGGALRIAGHVVDTANSWADALARITRRRYGLVVYASSHWAITAQSWVPVTSATSRAEPERDDVPRGRELGVNRSELRTVNVALRRSTAMLCHRA